MTSQQPAGTAEVRHAVGMRPSPRIRLGRWLRTVVTASDPGLERLRSAGTTVATLLVALGVLYGLVTLVGQPVTSAVLGVVVAMIASLAVTDRQPGPRAVTTALLVPCAAAAATLAALLSPHQVVADAAFVGVAVVAVFLRLLGPRGMPMGMICFIAYFLALFVQLTLGQLPVAIASAAVGALVSWAMAMVLRPRRPGRDLDRMLSALAARAAAVVDSLVPWVAEAERTERDLRRLGGRLAASGEAALLVEQRLDAADERLSGVLGNDELSVRVFDFQLTVEHLVAAARAVPDDGLPPAAREALAAALVAAGAALGEGTGSAASTRLTGLDPLPATHDGGPEQSDEGSRRVLTALQHVVDGWLRVIAPQPDDDREDDREDGEADDRSPQDDAGDDRPPGQLADTARQAVQVAVAAALAIVVGELLSPTRWFWAAIAAFVVFTGTSTSGETLSKGWQRVVGTLAGVVAGVVVGALVGGNVPVAVALIVLSVFLAVYLMRLSPGWMIFFITTMLALLYGLLGQFSVGLLLVRLEETAAGAAIGVLVSFLVFPSSTRRAARRAAADFLRDLDELLDHMVATLAGERDPGSRAQAAAGDLRTSFDAVKSAAKPLTEGLAGIANRSGYQRTLRLLAGCEHHARTLARLADTAAGAAAGPGLEPCLRSAVDDVRANVDAVAAAFDDDGHHDGHHDGDHHGVGGNGVPVRPADPALDALDEAVATAADAGRGALQAVCRHLRAIDQALCGLAADRDAAPGAASHPTARGVRAGGRPSA